MNIGDTVVAQGENRRGKIVGQPSSHDFDVEFGEPDHIGHKVKTMSRYTLYRVIHLDEAVQAAKIQQDLPNMIELLNRACVALFPEEKEISLSEEGVGVSLMNDVISIQPCIYEQKRIGAIQEVAGWAVSVWADDGSDNTTEHPNYWTAVRHAIDAARMFKSEQFWDRDYTYSYAGDFEQGIM